MLLKSCKHCGKLIQQSLKMCKECEGRYHSRHVVYNSTRRDEKATAFYVSKEWRALRKCIINVFDNIDIYALYIEHELLTCEPVHHIIELEEDWEQRLNPMNLIPLNQRTHNTITSLYKKSNASMKETQNRLREVIEQHFKGVGGYKKVLCDAGLVAPPFSFEKTPHEKFNTRGNLKVVSECDTI